MVRVKRYIAHTRNVSLHGANSCMRGGSDTNVQRSPAHPISTSHAQRDHKTANTHNRDTPQNDTQIHTQKQRATPMVPALAPAPSPNAWLRFRLESWKMNDLPTSRCAVRK